MDDLTIKVQMAAQRQLLKSMDVEKERDAALARAEAAEAALADARMELETADDLLALTQWQAGQKERAEAAEAALATAQDELDDLMAQRDVAEAALERLESIAGELRADILDERARAEAALAERDKPCLWTVVSDPQRKYQSGCTSDWWDRKFLYCPDCGHEIVIEVGRRVAA